MVYDSKTDCLKLYIEVTLRLAADYKTSGGEINDVAITGYMLRHLPATYNASASICTIKRNNVSRVDSLILGKEIRQNEQRAHSIQAGSTVKVSKPARNKKGIIC
jgi:hypothetical protein